MIYQLHLQITELNGIDTPAYFAVQYLPLTPLFNTPCTQWTVYRPINEDQLGEGFTVCTSE